MGEPDQPDSAESADFGGLIQEQLLVDLDQTIGDREQAVADHEQERLDRAQGDLDDERRLQTGEASFAEDAELEQRQSALDRADERRDAHQMQLDATQIGRDDRQAILNTQYTAVGGVRDDERARQAAITRAAVARERADAARTRADQAEARAVQAAQRAASRGE